MLLTQKKNDPNWNSSASHVTHQVGVPTSTEAETASTEKATTEPVLERKSSKVSFDEPVETKMQRKDSYSGVTRVSFEKPADLYVTTDDSKQSAVESADKPADTAAAVPEVKTDASNTGTAKRKSKKKRDEVCETRWSNKICMST